MENHPMVTALRIAGWGFFGLGLGLFLYAGGLGLGPEATEQRTLAWVGIFGALFGMLLTSTSRLIGHFANMRHMREQAQLNNPFRKEGELKPAEKPPDPPTPA
jgi:hypothetical protein